MVEQHAISHSCTALVSHSSAGCAKRPSSKAAASEGANRTLAVRWAAERRENAAGGLFPHPASRDRLRSAPGRVTKQELPGWAKEW